MKIVVIGGTGLIGTNLVHRLRQSGHEVIAASPRNGINALTREGLAEALLGAQVVVDVANSPSFEDKAVLEFFERSGRNLLAAEAAAGVGHHVALSVVGTDRVPESGYLRAKAAQEKLIEASKIPYTILRATQFYEFVSGIVQAGADGDLIRLSPALLQPIAADDVAAVLAEVTVAAPVNGIVEVAGPEKNSARRHRSQISRGQRRPATGCRGRSRSLFRCAARRHIANAGRPSAPGRNQL